jgi:hypothetical protein
MVKRKGLNMIRGLTLLLTLLVGACQSSPDSTMEAITTQSPLSGLSGENATVQIPPRLPINTPTLLILPTATSTATKAPTPTTEVGEITAMPIPTTSLLFTGVIVPARCVQAAIDAKGDSDYLYDEVRATISQADLAIGTLNATISDFPPRTGCLPTYVLVGGSENADALQRAGFDLMSVATNHIKNCGVSNCGDRAFFDTLENLNRVGVLPVGAGANLQEAMQAVVRQVNGVRFGFVSLGQLEPLVFAAEDVPGIAVLNEGNLRSAIEAARKVSDVVIVMPHWGPEDVSRPNWSQLELARLAVEAGADLVVGNHTHVVQAYQEIDGVHVFYGLGNFVFDQNWALDHQQGVMLVVNFQGIEMIDYQLIPTHVDFDGLVHIAGEQEAAEILARIEETSRSLP